MGLDMYLNAREVINDAFKDVEDYNNWWANDGIPGLEPELGEAIEVGYWRKVNAVHGWFVRNCQNGVDECQLSVVTREQLQQLYDICYQIIQKPSLASQLLPVTSGFFFGGSEYDEWYHNGVEQTAEIIYKALHDDEYDDMYFTYQSSW